MITAKIIINGMVQGVGFRFFCRKKAVELGLQGYAKNLYNGDVEIEVEGEKHLIEEFVREIKVGPRSADVNSVNVTEREYENKYSGFSIF